MSVPLWFVLLQAVSTPDVGGVIERYSIDARLDPGAGRVEATATLDLKVPEGGLSSLELFLNEGLDVADVRSDAAVLGVTRHADRLGEFQFAPTAVPVEVVFGTDLEPGRALTLAVRYGGTIVGDPWGTNGVTEGWVELGMYAAWFPLKPDEKAFTSSVRVTLDSTYTVAGAGRVAASPPTEGGRVWTLEDSRPSDDIVVIAGRGLRRQRVGAGAAAVTLYASRLGPAEIERVASDAQDIVDSETEWFGDPEPIPLTVVLADRDRGGGYARPGLVVLTYDGDPEAYARFAKGLAHEISHLWWSRAPTTTWEDWLNESFAEYSALMWTRRRMGEDVFADYVSRYEEQSEDLPPIRDLARDDEAAYAVLYRKGPTVLFRLEETMGREEFLLLLRAMHADRIRSTEELLGLVRRRASLEATRVLESGLSR